jgi:uncharacterized membrane protein required for colicin V production
MELITLPENIVTFINITLITLALVLALIGYLRGFISQAYDLIIMGLGLLLGTLISPVLANNFSMVPSSVNFNDIPFVGSSLVLMIDKILWTIIFVFIFLIVGFIFKGFLIKKVLRYNKKVLVDRIGGAVFGLVPVLALGFVIALTLSVPMFSNGVDLLKASILSPFEPISSGLVVDLVDNNPTLNLVDKISSGEPLGEEDLVIIEETLKDIGFPEEVVEVAQKFITKEEVTEADVEVLKTYAEENEITPEQVQGWMKDLGFTEQQIEDLMNQYQ